MFTTYYMQVLSLGLVWTFFHCSGMCGPLVVGLTASADEDQPRWRRLAGRAQRVLAYQSGRALTYAALGVIAGLLGAAFESTVRDVTAISGFVVAPIFLALGVWKVSGHAMPGGAGGAAARWTTKLLRRVRKGRWAQHHLVRSAVTGVVMGLLPCVLMFWVLGVAASTASPLHGAGVMVTLVVLTTPTLLAAGCAASMWRIRMSERIVGVLLILSSGWLLLVALAANGIIDHVDVSFRIGGRPFMLMFF